MVVGCRLGGGCMGSRFHLPSPGLGGSPDGPGKGEARVLQPRDQRVERPSHVLRPARNFRLDRYFRSCAEAGRREQTKETDETCGVLSTHAFPTGDKSVAGWPSTEGRENGASQFRPAKEPDVNYLTSIQADGGCGHSHVATRGRDCQELRLRFAQQIPLPTCCGATTAGGPTL